MLLIAGGLGQVVLEGWYEITGFRRIASLKNEGCHPVKYWGVKAAGSRNCRV